MYQLIWRVVAVLTALPAFSVAFLAPSTVALGAHSATRLPLWSTTALRTPPPCTHVQRQSRGASLKGLRCAVDLEGWMAKNGGKSSCSISAAGLVAQRDLKAGEEACSVAVKACLTAASAKEAFGDIADTVDAETAIALQLLLEKSKGPGSAWAEWLASLPGRDALDLPYFWPKEDQKMLQGTSVMDAIEENEEAFKEEFEQLSTQGWAGKFPAGTFTLQNYEWAVSIVSSRSVYAEKFPGSLVLAPYVDTAFTSMPSTGKTEFYYDGMFREPRVKVSVGVGGVRRGETVAIDYAGKSPSKMLQQHGVARLDNKNGAYEVSFSVSPMDRFRDDKIDVLEINRMPEELTIRFTANDYLTADQIAFLRLVCLQGTDAFLLESVFRNEVWGFMQEPVSEANEKLMLDTLIATCEGSLEGFLSSDSDDRKALASGSVRAQRAAAVRVSEKSALKNTILILEEELETLDEKEYYQQRRLRMLKLDRPLDESEIVDPDVDIRRENVPRL